MIAACALASACIPAAASAATVSYTAPDPSVGSEFDGLEIVSRGHEQSTLSARFDGHGDETVRELGHAALRAGRGCRQRSRRVVRCKVHLGDTADALQVYLGGGDDRFRTAGPTAFYGDIDLYGGPGDDTIELSSRAGGRIFGASGRDVLIGSRNVDFIVGGSGRDVLRGRAGADALEGRRGDDVLEGGRGRDSADWSEQGGPVRIDLATGTGGGRGEHDRLVSIEEVLGGSGDDRLIGNRAANTLDGGPGADTIDGRGGDDWIGAGSGNDLGGDEHADRLHCGPGSDEVHDPDRDLLPPDCELLSMSDYGLLDGQAIHAQPRARKGGVAMQLVCSDACTRRINLRSRGHVLGHSDERAMRQGVKAWIFVALAHPLTGHHIDVVVSGTDDDGENKSRYRFVWRLSR